MYIFIDETGNFELKEGEHFHGVTALICPSFSLDRIYSNFTQIENELSQKHNNRESKKLLFNDYSALNDVFSSLVSEKCIVECVFLHMDTHLKKPRTTDSASKRKELLLDLISSDTEIEDNGEINGILEKSSNLSEQEFIQLFLYLKLTENIIRYYTPWYANESPGELEQYKWVFDAKQSGTLKLSRMEQLYTDIIIRFLRKQDKKNGIFQRYSELDYTHFERHIERKKKLSEEEKKYFEMEDNLSNHCTEKGYEILKISNLVSDRMFDNEDNQAGLKIAHTIARFLYRSLKNGVSNEGKAYETLTTFSRLLTLKAHGNCVEFLHLLESQDDEYLRLKNEVAIVINCLNEKARIFELAQSKKM